MKIYKSKDPNEDIMYLKILYILPNGDHIVLVHTDITYIDNPLPKTHIEDVYMLVPEDQWDMNWENNIIIGGF